MSLENLITDLNKKIGEQQKEITLLNESFNVLEEQQREFYKKNKSLQKENEKLKGFVEYLQARNKDMININDWHMKTNKHLKERIVERCDILGGL